MDIVEKFIEDKEDDMETPLGHRVAKVALAGIAGVLAAWAVERIYDRLTSDDDDNSETTED